MLTEAQVIALERKKYDDEACGEIETTHPGYLGSFVEKNYFLYG